MPVNCMELNEDDIRGILAKILFEFPIREIERRPCPAGSPPSPARTTGCKTRAVRHAAAVMPEASGISATYASVVSALRRLPHVTEYSVGRNKSTSARGSVRIGVNVERRLFYSILVETAPASRSARTRQPDGASWPSWRDIRKKYDAGQERPRRGGGHRLRHRHAGASTSCVLRSRRSSSRAADTACGCSASAPSIHMMRADITTEVSPIVGSEKQSEDLVLYLLKEFEEDPVKIWDSNIFGKIPARAGQRGAAHQAFPHAGRRPHAPAGDHRARHQRGLQRPDLHYFVSLGRAPSFLTNPIFPGRLQIRGKWDFLQLRQRRRTRLCVGRPADLPAAPPVDGMKFPCYCDEHL